MRFVVVAEENRVKFVAMTMTWDLAVAEAELYKKENPTETVYISEIIAELSLAPVIKPMHNSGDKLMELRRNNNPEAEKKE